MTTRRIVIDHVDLLVADLEASRRFYEAALAPLGFGITGQTETFFGFGVEGAEDFAINLIAEGDTSTRSAHVAFVAEDKASVDAFYAAALVVGGRSRFAPTLHPEITPATTAPSSGTRTATTSRPSSTTGADEVRRPEGISVIERPTARVILLDPQDRILLFKYEADYLHDSSLPADAVQPRVFWATPGGGLAPGETFEQAAIRELWEETGINDADFGPVAFEREKRIFVRGEPILGRERYFVARTTVTKISLLNQEDLERADYRDHRWWTLAELSTTAEVIFPEGFAARVEDVLAET